MLEVKLLFPEKSFVEGLTPSDQYQTLFQDLGLHYILDEMVSNDTMKKICKQILLSPLNDMSVIKYRQTIINDFIANPSLMKELQEVLKGVEEKQRKGFWLLSSQFSQGKISSAVSLLLSLNESLDQLCCIAKKYYHLVNSDGLQKLLSMFLNEFNEEYINSIKNLLEDLKFYDGMLMSATLGRENIATNYVLHSNYVKPLSLSWMFAPSFTLAPKDQAGAQDFGNRRLKALSNCGQILLDAAENVKSFFQQLRIELYFYDGVLNLVDYFGNTLSWCFPICESNLRHTEDLYDLALSISHNFKPIGNDLALDYSSIIIITGANQGGKTTFLRSLGQAQILFQSGMMVPAKAFKGPIYQDIFTHFKKEEDVSLNSGKLDEELSRMNLIIDRIKPKSLLLCNESFSSTNELEGSEIHYQVAKALIEYDIDVITVTHLINFATRCVDFKNATYLRAQRLENGDRNYKLEVGSPLHTGFGLDIYCEVFSTSPDSK